MERFCLVDDCPGEVLAKCLCSRHYYNYRTHGTPLPEIACADCGKELPGAHASRIRCEQCAKGRLNALRRAKNPRRAPAPVDCHRCGAKTPPTTHTKRMCSACSRECVAECAEQDCIRPVRAKGVCNMHYERVLRAEGRLPNPEWDDRRRNNYHKRRALKAGSAAGPAFTNAEVFERDGWVCGLCDEPVSPDVVYPDPLSASLDHVVPLSRGGAHSFSNSQLAHLACNVRKGAREDVSLSA